MFKFFKRLLLTITPIAMLVGTCLGAQVDWKEFELQIGSITCDGSLTVGSSTVSGNSIVLGNLFAKTIGSSTTVNLDFGVLGVGLFNKNIRSDNSTVTSTSCFIGNTSFGSDTRSEKVTVLGNLAVNKSDVGDNAGNFWIMQGSAYKWSFGIRSGETVNRLTLFDNVNDRKAATFETNTDFTFGYGLAVSTASQGNITLPYQLNCNNLNVVSTWTLQGQGGILGTITSPATISSSLTVNSNFGVTGNINAKTVISTMSFIGGNVGIVSTVAGDLLTVYVKNDSNNVNSGSQIRLDNDTSQAYIQKNASTNSNAQIASKLYFYDNPGYIFNSIGDFVYGDFVTNSTWTASTCNLDNAGWGKFRNLISTKPGEGYVDGTEFRGKYATFTSTVGIGGILYTSLSGMQIGTSSDFGIRYLADHAQLWSSNANGLGITNTNASGTYISTASYDHNYMLLVNDQGIYFRPGGNSPDSTDVSSWTLRSLNLSSSTFVNAQGGLMVWSSASVVCPINLSNDQRWGYGNMVASYTALTGLLEIPGGLKVFGTITSTGAGTGMFIGVDYQGKYACFTSTVTIGGALTGTGNWTSGNGNILQIGSYRGDSGLGYLDLYDSVQSNAIVITPNSGNDIVFNAGGYRVNASTLAINGLNLSSSTVVSTKANLYFRDSTNITVTSYTAESGQWNFPKDIFAKNLSISGTSYFGGITNNGNLNSTTLASSMTAMLDFNILGNFYGTSYKSSATFYSTLESIGNLYAMTLGSSMTAMSNFQVLGNMFNTTHASSATFMLDVNALGNFSAQTFITTSTFKLNLECLGNTLFRTNLTSMTYLSDLNVLGNIGFQTVLTSVTFMLDFENLGNMAFHTVITTITFNDAAEVKGTLTIGAYTLPNTDGGADQVLETNGSGVLSWTDVAGVTGKMDDTPDVVVSTSIKNGVITNIKLNNEPFTMPSSFTVLNGFSANGTFNLSNILVQFSTPSASVGNVLGVCLSSVSWIAQAGGGAPAAAAKWQTHLYAKLWHPTKYNYAYFYDDEYEVGLSSRSFSIIGFPKTATTAHDIEAESQFYLDNSYGGGAITATVVWISSLTVGMTSMYFKNWGVADVGTVDWRSVAWSTSPVVAASSQAVAAVAVAVSSTTFNLGTLTKNTMNYLKLARDESDDNLTGHIMVLDVWLKEE